MSKPSSATSNARAPAGKRQERAVALDLLDQLDAEPSRHDIAWRIGVDEQVSDARLRTLELSNFLEHLQELTRA